MTAEFHSEATDIPVARQVKNSETDDTAVCKLIEPGSAAVNYFSDFHYQQVLV